MEVKFVLDFDGVLFNSAFEAYTVANKATEGRPEYRDDISYEEFLAFRSSVTDAWHYNRLYSRTHGLPAAAIAGLQPDEVDWRFSRDFFEARKEIMQASDWPKVMPPYDFFFLLKPLLLQYPDRFAILSTRNIESIRQTMSFHGVDNLTVFGQEDIRKLGSKMMVAKEQRWLDRGKFLIVYVDDMNSHLEPFVGQIHLPLHADWGYDRCTPGSLSPNQIFTIISSLLNIAERNPGS
ncbi:MAG TPA: hypothetical protein VFF84_13970 [Sphingobium sp.]|nr:hypothetical protein [Sphingobium sp.]